ncbi:MAG TPA: NADH-quinone oxidoreductase subunit L [Candidatus Kapabacteria bacterium]|jgi:NADH-quinone oxidoreductase subunit L|nr:NADH-quinone oxidoreductase subunit L [Candidatus Kapabacteria bacterium]
MDPLVLLSLVTLGLPLLAFVLVIFNQRALSDRAHLIATPAIAFSLVLSLYVAWMKLKGAPQGVIEWSFDWIKLGSVPGFGPLAITNGVLLDNVTAIMMVVVTAISFLVHIFSSEYMKNDTRYSRYFAYLGLFTFSMLGIVLVDNFFGLLIFWELVGFSSYVLIAHWYERPAPQYAAKKAFVTNRIGDACMWIGILLLFGTFHTFNFREIFGFINQGLPLSFSFLGFSPETTLTIAGILIFAGAIGKSAQFPLHVWLPDAMEGPTPVSALIHAATMVAAGVYLTARIFPMLTGDAMLVVACVGAFTSVLAATIAITQTDIKRVLAYSTISQLGLMIMSIGAGAVAAGIFHLVTHAAFKACLFLGSGSVIHAMHRALHATHDHETDAQDMRNMGGLLKKMPITGWTFLIATFAITGLPLMAGFMSKDEILAGATAYGTLQGGIAQALPYVGFGVTMLTAFYMWRQVFLVFFGVPRKPELIERIRESPRVMTVPLVVLAVLSLWIWYGRNPIDADHGWFLYKWIKTPAQIIPPQTAPQGPGYRIPGIAASSTILNNPNASPTFGYTIAGGPMKGSELPSDIFALPTSPMPHQIALERERGNDASFAMSISLGVAFLGFLLAGLFYILRPGLAGSLGRMPILGVVLFRPLYWFSKKGWFIDQIYDYAIVGTFLLTARIAIWADENILDGIVNASARVTVFAARTVGWFDKYIVDGIVTLVGATVQFLGLLVRSVQTGRIQTYLAWTVAGVVVLFVIVRYVILASTP